MTTSIVNVKTLSRKARRHNVARMVTVRGDEFVVTSGSSGRKYVVRLQTEIQKGSPPEMKLAGASCTCEWGIHRPSKFDFRSACSHVQAVFTHVLGEQGLAVSAWGDLESARRQRRRRVAIGEGVYLTLRKGNY